MQRPFAGRIRLGILVVTAYWLALFIATHIPDPGAQLPLNLWDKLQHFGAYGLLVCLLCVVFQTRPRPTPSRYASIFLIVITYGAMDEWLQSLVPGRHPDVFDWIANVLGAICAVAFHYVVVRWRTKRQPADAVATM